MHRIRGKAIDLVAPPLAMATDMLAFDGQCYAASEALFHLLGGKAAGYTPVCLTLTPDWQALLGTTHRTHWVLQDRWGGYLDPTRDQFPGEWTPPYYLGIRKGFLTKAPSAKAQVLIDTAKELL